MRFCLACILIVCLASCSSRIPIKEIEKDIGIKLPAKYKVLSKQSDFLGFNETDEYLLQFSTTDFQKLISEVKNSIAYNATKFDQFCKLDSARKISVADSLSKKECIGYWVDSEEGYLFDELTFGAVCPPIQNSNSATTRKIVFRNEDAKNGYPVYSVEAKINVAKRTLHYRYAHF